ncbi:DUF2460 domain-containing protein [Pectinatus frisingensis]|uniref:DUF2460 domain-containing protein n=1 Tax=Pectinatus frisingensis TaxID=865 RepID=UPI0018C721D7|nr:DUF2460 domain-containing protein [Pectinatus frisingensis]
MSDLLFPTLQGLQYPISKTPHWNTIKNRSLSGIPTYVQCYSYPYYSLKLSFAYLSDDGTQASDIQTLMGFYNNVGGAGQDFLFADPLIEENTVSGQAFGNGDGASTDFRLTRNYGGYPEYVFGLLTTPTITSTVNGVTTTLAVNTDFTWDTTAMITFTTAPVAGAILEWSGAWYYRCHFVADDAEFQQLFQGGWGLDELELESVKLK